MICLLHCCPASSECSCDFVLLGPETAAAEFAHADCQLHIFVFFCSITNDPSRCSGSQGSRCGLCLVCGTLIRVTDVIC